MFYLIRYVNTKDKGPKNTWYTISEKPPRNDAGEIISTGRINEVNGVISYAEGDFPTYDLASQEIPDEFEEEKKGMFTDPRPIVPVSEWIKEDIPDIRIMEESVIDEYIAETIEDADIEGVILSGDLRSYILKLRAEKGRSVKK